MFWSNVRQLLSERKILQRDFAEQIGYNVSTLKNQMTRNISPDVDTAVKIAKALNTSVEFLVTGEEPDQFKAEFDQFKKRILELGFEIVRQASG